MANARRLYITEFEFDDVKTNLKKLKKWIGMNKQ